MSEKLEGTFCVDGLIEGKIAGEKCQARLREWISSLKALNLPFNLEIDGGSFSVLAEPDTLLASTYMKTPQDLISHALNELLEIFDLPDRSKILSTIRSLEYSPGKEIQTLYAVGPNGKIETRDRVLEVQTKAMPEPLSRKEKIKIAFIGLAIVALIFGISSFFVDYRDVFARIVEQVVPFNPQDLSVDNGLYEKFFIVEGVTKGQGNRMVFVTLRRTPLFPENSAQAELLIKNRGNSLAERLAVESLVKGYVRYEFYDKENKFMGSGELRVEELKSYDVLKVELPLPSKHNPAVMRLKY